MLLARREQRRYVVNSKEYKVIERKGKSDKQILKEKLESFLSKATSRNEWHESISQSELGLYTRGKNQRGTFNERNYRLNTLGFTEERLSKLDQIEQSLQEINTIRKDNKLEKEPEKSTVENQEDSNSLEREIREPNLQGEIHEPNTEFLIIRQSIKISKDIQEIIF